MQRENSSELIAGLAAQYAAGALAPDEARAFEDRLAAGDRAYRDALAQLDPVVGALLAAAPEMPPPTAIRAQVLARIDADEVAKDPSAAVNPQVWKGWAGDGVERSMIVRRADEAWEPTGLPGITTRRLFVDRARNQITMLVRMAAGTGYPAHRHGGPEECYVLEGDLHVGATRLGAGDYQRVASGSHHPIQRTEHGCTLLLVSSLTDELT